MLAIFRDCAIIFLVSERNIMKNKMTTTEIKATCNDWHEVTCCLCGGDETITGEEVGQWDHGIENFECPECE